MIFASLSFLALGIVLAIVARVFFFAYTGTPRSNVALSAVAAVSVLALSVLAISSYRASNLDISDSEEYVSGAQQLLSRGEFVLKVGDQLLPSRYAPWFSVIGVAPFLAPDPSAVGNAVYSVTLFGVIAILAAFFIGARFGSLLSAALAAMAVLIVPGFVYFSQQVMTDIPCSALMLVALLIYLLLRDGHSERSSLIVAAGIIIGVAASFRPVALILLFPFMLDALDHFRLRRRLLNFMLLLLPSIAFASATLLYQQHVFGNALRSGYHFWVPVPYDQSGEVFSVKYIRQNFPPIAIHSGLLLLVLLASSGPFILRWALRQGREHPFHTHTYCESGKFVGMVTLPSLLFYSLYFYATIRFYLPFSIMFAVVAGALMGSVGDALAVKRKWVVPIVLLFAVLVLMRRALLVPPIPERRLAVDRLFVSAPPMSTVVTSLDPVYTELFRPVGNQVKILPISRRIEFASKVLAPRPLVLPMEAGESWRETRVRLLKAGGIEAVPTTALEQAQLLANDVAAGKIVLFDSSGVTVGEQEEVARHFSFDDVAHALIWLRPKS